MKKIILYDINEKLIEEWEKVFKDIPNIECKKISFAELEADYVVTAGNSYGWMTGGLDLAVRNYYGQIIQDEVQRMIIYYHNGYLPVGEFLKIFTYDNKKPNLIYAPTMSKPQKIDIEDVFYVSSKLFEIASKMDGPFAICGLGTSTGGISEEECALVMRKAYDFVKKDGKKMSYKDSLEIYNQITPVGTALPIPVAFDESTTMHILEEEMKKSISKELNYLNSNGIGAKWEYQKGLGIVRIK